MKRVINGKTYNTATATQVAFYESPYYNNDYNWYREAIYKTKKGEYFVLGEGNANSPYAQKCGQNSWGGSSVIFLIPNKYIKEFIEADYDERKELCLIVEHYYLNRE